MPFRGSWSALARRGLGPWPDDRSLSKNRASRGQGFATGSDLPGAPSVSPRRLREGGGGRDVCGNRISLVRREAAHAAGTHHSAGRIERVAEALAESAVIVRNGVVRALPYSRRR